MTIDLINLPSDCINKIFEFLAYGNPHHDDDQMILVVTSQICKAWRNHLQAERNATLFKMREIRKIEDEYPSGFSSVCKGFRIGRLPRARDLKFTDPLMRFQTRNWIGIACSFTFKKAGWHLIHANRMQVFDTRFLITVAICHHRRQNRLSMTAYPEQETLFLLNNMDRRNLNKGPIYRTIELCIEIASGKNSFFNLADHSLLAQRAITDRLTIVDLTAQAAS